MRSIDLAVYADALAAERTTLAMRIEGSRSRLRQAALEHEARQELSPDVVERLERIGLLGTRATTREAAEIEELTAATAALERLQAWVERRLAEQVAGYAAALAPSPASRAAR